jgi:hypothetical protein
LEIHFQRNEIKIHSARTQDQTKILEAVADYTELDLRDFLKD